MLSSSEKLKGFYTFADRLEEFRLKGKCTADLKNVLTYSLIVMILSFTALFAPIFASGSDTPTGGTYMVTPKGAGDGSGDGWENAMSGDRFADFLRSKATGGWNGEFVFYVARGTYKPVKIAGSSPTTDERSTYFTLSNNVKIYGGFVGNEEDPDDRVLSDDANETVFSGNIGTNYSFHVIYAKNANNVVIDGITVECGNASLSTSDERKNGGGAYLKDTSADISGCIFRKNEANNNGGAIYSENSDIRIASSAFVSTSTKKNTAKGYGGALCVSGDACCVQNCTFDENKATNGGGAIAAVNKSNVSVANCVLHKNVATATDSDAGLGGGVYCKKDSNQKSTVAIVNTIFWENSNDGSNYGSGPDIYNEGTTEVKNSIFKKSNVYIKSGSTFTSADCSEADPFLSPTASKNGGPVPVFSISAAGSAFNTGLASGNYTVAGLTVTVPQCDARGVLYRTNDIGAYAYTVSESGNFSASVVLSRDYAFVGDVMSAEIADVEIPLLHTASPDTNIGAIENYRLGENEISFSAPRGTFTVPNTIAPGQYKFSPYKTHGKNPSGQNGSFPSDIGADLTIYSKASDENKIFMQTPEIHAGENFTVSVSSDAWTENFEVVSWDITAPFSFVSSSDKTAEFTAPDSNTSSGVITVRYMGLLSGVQGCVSADIAVTPPHPVVTFDTSSLVLAAGSRKTLGVSVVPDTGAAVVWSVSDGNIVSVTQNGEVTGLCEGKATIMANVQGGTPALCEVTVRAAFTEDDKIVCSEPQPVMPQSGSTLPSDIIPLMAEYLTTPEKQNNFIKSCGIRDSDTTLAKSGTLYLSPEIIKSALANAAGEIGTAEETSIIPITLSKTSESGMIHAISFAVSGDIFGEVENATRIKVISLLTAVSGDILGKSENAAHINAALPSADTNGGTLRVITDESSACDGSCALYDENGIISSEIDKNKTYKLTVFVRDGDIYDADGKANRMVYGTFGIIKVSAEEPQKTSGSSVGCNALNLSLLLAVAVTALLLLYQQNREYSLVSLRDAQRQRRVRWL
ncbi:MAG: Ig-like domain-containing protein [Synergistes sp.]|nr:Ig-like domain-containing protein [Synergistes sp.]